MVSERNKFIFILAYEKLSFVSLFSLAPVNFSLSFHFEIFCVIKFFDLDKLEAYQTNRTDCSGADPGVFFKEGVHSSLALLQHQ